MGEKRPRPEDDNHRNDSKRSRSNDGSTASPINGANVPKPSIQEQIALAKKRAAEARERIAGTKITSSASTTDAGPAEAARAKVEAMKARVAALTKKSGVVPPQHTTVPVPTYRPPELEEGSSRARGGLGIGLHPSLMGDATQDSRIKSKTAMAPKFGTTMGNRRAESPILLPTLASLGKAQLDLSGPSLEDLKKNPYFDSNINGASAVPKGRKTRELLFHQKGKFIAQAAALRRQAHLEEMKRRIAESARKAGLDEDHSEQAFVVTQPPNVEWWDEGLIDGSAEHVAYPDFDHDAMAAEKRLKIDTDDSVITRYVQHPVLLVPPQEKVMPAPRAMFMTKEEQAKKRRQDRMEQLKEKQAKVRLGLEPPEPPKIKKSNLMRVLGEQAVKDPTAVEARVNREIAERKEKHNQANEDRKLTKEQRDEKLAANQAQDAARGVLVNVYRIDSLAYGKHRYQVDINAKQHALTGITILNPRLNLVIVEGGQHSIAKYKKLMLNRIKWTENAPLTTSAKEGKKKDATEASWLQPYDETGELRDLGGNRCILVWEGEERGRAFKKWGSRVCETDSQARQALERSKMENMWQRAKEMTE